MTDKEAAELTFEHLPTVLARDTKVKVAGVDVDGILRGKLMSKKKFLSIAKDGFGFCSVVFGWDMHDTTYFKELKISNKENGYRDMVAIPDLATFRRIPWEDNVPFFMVSFFEPDTGKPVSACPRSLLRTATEKVEKGGYSAMAGGAHESLVRLFFEKLLIVLIFHQPSMSSSNFAPHQPTACPTRNGTPPRPQDSSRKTPSTISLHSQKACSGTV